MGKLTLKPELSVIIPFYNEESNVIPLLEELTEALKKLKTTYEIICINDGSIDSTVSKITYFRDKHNPGVRLISFKKNAGLTAVFHAGFRFARGKYFLTLDGDRQNDPADIARFFSLRKRYDLVIGIRKRREDNWVRRLSSRVANGIRNFLTDDNIIDSACAFKLYRSSFLKNLPLFKGLHRFFPTLCKMRGAKVKQLTVNHRPRVAGIAKYGVLNRIFVSFFDCLVVAWMKKRKFHYSLDKKNCDLS
ncbi:glycosyltransferase family 2 protein [Candidatus Riflebacteria bacterium]